MTRLLVVAFCIALAGRAAGASGGAWQPPAGHARVPIWPGAAPGAPAVPSVSESTATETPAVAGRAWTAVYDVAVPTMTVYSPRRNNGAAVVVFPGGGYHILAIDLEGTEVCDWLRSRGITCVLLKYRVPRSGPSWERGCNCYVGANSPAALQDAQRTVGLVRRQAAKWRIDPHKIGVLGFSAGGHLVANISTHFAQRAYRAVDAADDESCRPDFAILLYPGHLWAPHTASGLNSKITVTRRTPPSLLVQAKDDPVDDVHNSLVYYAALKRAGVPAELHVYAHGGHAFGLRRTALPITRWPEVAESWLRSIGMMPR